MRTKSFVLFLLCVIVTSVLLILVGNQRPSIHSLVSETHKQLNNLKNFKENLDNAEEKKLIADDRYLNLLGFTESPRLYPASVWKNTSLPIIVTYVLSGQEQQGLGFARNVAHLLPNHTAVIYNLGLGSYALQTLQSHCNSSRCTVVSYDLSLFPSHVEDDRVRAFRPLVIQDAMNRAGAVLYMDNDYRLVSGKIEPLLRQAGGAGGGGVVSWATRHATTSLTHPKMFDYFRAAPDDFLFLPMVEANTLILYNTADVHARVMLPWVQCALTQDCIHPIGAQDGGCRYNKKPQYRYSGCHRYDSSALNIVLGLRFDFDDTKYTAGGHEAVFRRVTPDAAAAETAGLESNDTDASSNKDGLAAF